jgi:anti-sigma B factor antagonist
MHVIEARRPDLEPALELTIRYVGQRAVLRAAGEIDIETAPVVAKVGGCLLSAGARELWIDLAAVGFIDLDGVHTLLDLEERATEDRRRFAVVSPQEPVRRAFDTTGASRRLRMVGTRSGAHHPG